MTATLPNPPTLHLHIDRSHTTGGLEILATATIGENRLQDATEPFLWPDLAVEPNGRSVRLVEEERGLRLWRALLPGRVQAKLNELRELAGHQACLLRLTFGKDLPERAKLEKLPWEILWDPATGQFLGQDRKLLLVRTAEKVLACPPLADAPPLRILVVTASPSGHHSVGAEKEIADIIEIWRDRAHVFVLEDALFETFCRQVRAMDSAGGVHIVHFIGHGGTRTEDDETLLLFQNTDGGGAYITAAQVADQLRGLASLRLVVLNACHSFDPPELPGGEPCRSVALELARRGVPAVIGTSHAIGIELATRFSGHLHRALSQGLAIPEAVCEARLALKAESGDKLSPRTGIFEWATPILYLTAPNGNLLRFADLEAEKRPLHLGIRSRLNPHRPRLEAEHLLDLLELFDDRQPRTATSFTEALARLRQFLVRYCGQQLPVKLTMDAHLSLAFAAGYLLTARSCPVLIDQHSAYRTGREGEPWDKQRLWNFAECPALAALNSGAGREDLAIAVSVVHDALPEVESYCLAQRGRRWRGLNASIAPEIGPAAMQGEAHCAALAKSLVAEAARLRGKRDVHIFGAIPISLAFEMGRLGTELGTVHLYEYDFGGKKGYSPSLVLTPADQAGPRSST